MTLLAAMSMLDHAATPLSLLRGHNARSLAGLPFSCMGQACRSDPGRPCYSSTCNAARQFDLFADAVTLDRACTICAHFGLIRPAPQGSGTVGMMHQQVQHGIRRTMATRSRGQAVGTSVRRMMLDRFHVREHMSPSEWPALLEIAPCIAAWFQVVLHSADIDASVYDTDLFDRWGRLLHLLGDEHRAEIIFARVLELRRRLLPADHPDIASAMGNLANTYSALGRHDNALVLQEEAVAFRKRVLPPDHPHIAMAMGNLAATYSALGRHDAALVLQEEVVAFRKRVLPPGHPDIAMAVGNLAATYSALGRDDDARLLKEEVVAL